MPERKQPKKRKQKAADKQPHTERRFQPEALQTTKIAVGAGLLGALVLGAGVYEQWLRDPPFKYSPYLIVVGALGVVGGLMHGDLARFPVRVGDAGVAIENGTELKRLAWCDMRRIHVDRGALVLEGDPLLKLAISTHRAAVSWILKEAVERVPQALDVKANLVESLPQPQENAGTRVPIEMLQIAGRHCASSQKPIAFERDARLCPVCAQVYHKEHVPKSCVTCGSQITGRTFAV
jgi:hypothetical protein